MKRIVRVGWAMAILTVTAAVFAVAPATADLTAEKYPTKLTGTAPAENGKHYLDTNYTELSCSTPSTLSAELTEPVDQITTTPTDAGCKAGSLNVTLKMNGCTLTPHVGLLRPDGKLLGTVDIGGGGCSGITAQILTCKITIPSQTGLKASFSSEGSGTGSKVILSAEFTEMTYSQTDGLCGGEQGTFENGTYTGKWVIAGAGPTGVQVSAAEGPAGFVSEQYPATLSGAQKEADRHTFNFGTGPGLPTISCKTATFAGSLSGASATLSVAPTYPSGVEWGECIAKREGLENNATVKANGCQYTLTADGDSVDIDCPQGKVLELTSGTCQFHIPPQDGLTAIQGDLFTTGSGVFGISLDWDGVGGMTFKAIDGFLCPLSGTAEYSNGAFAGTTTIEASNAKGVPIGIWAQ